MPCFIRARSCSGRSGDISVSIHFRSEAVEFQVIVPGRALACLMQFRSGTLCVNNVHVHEVVDESKSQLIQAMYDWNVCHRRACTFLV